MPYFIIVGLQNTSVHNTNRSETGGVGDSSKMKTNNNLIYDVYENTFATK